jgi:hypothetical protein
LAHNQSGLAARPIASPALAVFRKSRRVIPHSSFPITFLFLLGKSGFCES